MATDPKHLSLDFAKGTLVPSTSTTRTLKDLQDFFADTQTAQAVLKSGSNPIIYEVFESLQPPDPGNLDIGTTILYPGRIGSEFYMTKGHYHIKEDSSEIYVGLAGDGVILLQSRSGNPRWIRMGAGDIVVVPHKWGHRAVNVGQGRLIFFFIYPAEAGHDYESIQKQGFSKLVVEKNNTFEVVDNPRFTRKG